MSSEDIKLSFRDGVRKILFNRPEKKNAIKREMYSRLADILNEDAKNDQIVVTIVTGVGEYYSSGNDLKSSMAAGAADFEPVRKLIQAFIDYPKLLIAVLNGPAIGIAATTAALCDIIYASDKAYFDTPFLRLGLCAEGTSSYTFPKIMGRSKASEALLLSKKISAQEAYTFGLVSEVIPHAKLEAFIGGLYKYGSLSVNSVKFNKKLMMDGLRKTLTEVNNRELEALQTCMDSEEFAQAIMAFMKRKSKL